MIKKINSILFVCTGNTCRSVIAEYTFKEMAKDSLFNLKVSSAGISALEEMGLLSKTKEVLEKNNIPI
ncbi:MAG: low molecular weight protein arginine phosphatase, partial [bacterium]